MMSWRDHSDDKGCDLYQVLYRDDGVALGCVLRHYDGGLVTPTPTLWRTTCCGISTIDAARHAVRAGGWH
jgi:hypothetical protein